jgi:hypothetical protein
MEAQAYWDYLVDDMRVEIRALMNRGQRLALALTCRRELEMAPHVPHLIQTLVNDQDMEALCFALRAIYSGRIVTELFAPFVRTRALDVQANMVNTFHYQFGRLLCYATQYWAYEDVTSLAILLSDVHKCTNTRARFGRPFPMDPTAFHEVCPAHGCCHKPLHPCEVRTCDSMTCNTMPHPRGECALHGRVVSPSGHIVLDGGTCGWFCSTHSSMVKCETCDAMICMRYKSMRSMSNPRQIRPG